MSRSVGSGDERTVDRWVLVEELVPKEYRDGLAAGEGQGVRHSPFCANGRLTRRDRWRARNLSREFHSCALFDERIQLPRSLLPHDSTFRKSLPLRLLSNNLKRIIRMIIRRNRRRFEPIHQSIIDGTTRPLRLFV